MANELKDKQKQFKVKKIKKKKHQKALLPEKNKAVLATPAKPPKKPKKPRPVKQKKPKSEKELAVRQRFFAVLLVFFAFYLGISLLIAGLIYYSFTQTASNSDFYSVTVKFDDEDIYKFSASASNNSYGLYVPYSAIASICDFGLAGDSEKVAIYLVGNKDYIEMEENSTLVVINDNPVRLAYPVLFRNGEYYLPVILVENYIFGVSVTYDKGVCYISRQSTSDVTLKLQLPQTADKCALPENYYYDFTKEKNNT